MVARAALRALCAGALAIDVNTALLAASDALGLRTAHGGLLRFGQLHGAPVADAVGAGPWWRGVLVPATGGPGFATAFHIGVGLLMALGYAALPLRRAGWSPLRAGLACAALVWLLNAAVVLPAIGEGFAGSRSLGVPGMAAFAAIHTVFFVLLALLYDQLTDHTALDTD